MDNISKITNKRIQITLERIEKAQDMDSDRLDLSNIGLDLVPSSISYLKTLKYLDLRNNKLNSLPPEIANLQNLVILNISENYFQALPPDVLKLHNLKILDCSGNFINEIPANIGDLVNLSMLNIGYSYPPSTSLDKYISMLEEISKHA